MPRIPKEIQTLDQFRVVLIQEHDLKLYHNARQTMEPLLKQCVSVRESAGTSGHNLRIDDERLHAIVTKFEDALVIIAGAPLQDSCRHPWERTAFRPDAGLGPFEPIAWAELTLLRLAILCLQTASKKGRNSIQLPQWDVELKLAIVEYENAVTAWQEWKQEPPPLMQN